MVVSLLESLPSEVIFSIVLMVSVLIVIVVAQILVITLLVGHVKAKHSYHNEATKQAHENALSQHEQAAYVSEVQPVDNLQQHNRQQPNTEDSATAQLAQYIHENMQKGYSLAYLREFLEQHGYNSHQIQRAYVYLLNQIRK